MLLSEPEFVEELRTLIESQFMKEFPKLSENVIYEEIQKVSLADPAPDTRQVFVARLKSRLAVRHFVSRHEK